MLDIGTSRYLTGNFAPATDEVAIADLPVSGELPAVLGGRYLKNGPNPVTPPDPAAYHWFTGSGMVHGIRLRDGRAEWYRNRWVRSAAVADALGEPPRPGPVHAGMDTSPNTNVIEHGGRTLALVEAGGRPYQLTYELETVGPCDFGGTLPGGFTAHPKLDPATGELHAVAYFWGWDFVQYVVVGPDGSVTRTVDVPVGDGPMMHDFALTETSALVFDLPVTLSFDAAAQGARFPYRWNDSHPARVGVLPRRGEAADVQWFEVEPCYVFHPVNAYDDGDGRIVVDVIRHERVFANDHYGPNDATPTLDRWVLDPSRGRVAEERIDDRGQELPRVDERLVSRPHRFAYTAAATPLDQSVEATPGALFKHDLVRGTCEVHQFGAGAGINEGVFVPASPDAAEDDGFVLCLVYDAERGASDLVVLSAQDFTGPPVAAVHLPRRVPFGFHGNWVPDAAPHSPSGESRQP